MNTMNKIILASVALATLGTASGAVMAAQKVDPYHDGAHVADKRDIYTDDARSVTDPRDPFTDGGHISASPRDPFTDGGNALAGRETTTA